MPDELYKVEDVAKILKVHQNTVYEMLNSRELKGVRISHKLWRVWASDLENYLKQKEVKQND